MSVLHRIGWLPFVVAISVAVAVLYTQTLILSRDNRELRVQFSELADFYEAETGHTAPEPGEVPTNGRDGRDGRDGVGTPGEDGEDGEDGEPGRPPTEAEVLLAVATYCAAHNGCVGPQGPAGADGASVVGPAGAAGAPGADGGQGTQGPPGPTCPAGFVLSIMDQGPFAGWLACAPEGGDG